MDLSNRGENCTFADDQNIRKTNSDVEPKEKAKVFGEDEVKRSVEDGVLVHEEKDVAKNSNECDDHGEKKTQVNYDSIPVYNYPNKALVLLEMVQPHSQLPKPEVPPGMNLTRSPDQFDRSMSTPAESYEFEMPSIGKFFREKSNSLSAAITKGISSIKENTKSESYVSVTEFNLSGLKVIVNSKPEIGEGKKLLGRVSFFSRSNCRDCTAVRSFLRERKINYVEINIDVYPMREKELMERTGNGNVPQIFFNEKLFGGLVALNSLRNSEILDKKLEEMLAGKCPPDAPAPPEYGFDDQDEEWVDDMVQVVKVLRQRLPIQDRFIKLKIVKNCFSGAELVELLMHHCDCARGKAVEIGKQLARKHFMHHVFGQNQFEDEKNLYRFLEHESFISKCYNFRGSTNDSEPKDAFMLSQSITRIMSAILEAYASNDRRHVDYVGISHSEEFRRYLRLVEDLQRVNITTLTAEAKLSFFLNLYNAMAIHAVIRIGHPGGMIDRRSFFSDFQYVVGGYPYSLTAIRNGILRSNQRPPYSLIKPFASGDKRLELCFPKVNLLIHFGICNATRSSPAVKIFSPQGVESELRYAAREYFQRDDSMQVDLAKRTVYLSRMIKWYKTDFGQEKDMLKWFISYLDATKAGLLMHLLGDSGPVNIVYQNFDWSLNS